MIRRFGEEYYADDSARPGWHDDNARLSRRLTPLLRALDIDAERRVGQAVTSWRASLHHRLRGATQLGRTESGGMRVIIEVTDRVPPPVLQRLNALPDPLLWVLVHRAEIAATRAGIETLIREARTLNGPGGFDAIGFGREPLIPAADAIRALDDTAARRADDELQAILQMRGDTLGAYYYHRGRIELHWVVIWMIATRLRVAADDLALVVLAHEMAHLYTHAGQDADGHEWATPDFAGADDRIVEGLAQFYTELILLSLARGDEGNPRPLETFRRLLADPSEPYTCFQQWVPGHKNRAEVVRRALLRIRTRRVTDYGIFMDALSEAAADM